MWLSPIRALTDYLDDPSTGINFQLTEMTSGSLYDSGDTQPADIDTIVDETRDIEVARRFPPLEASGNDKPSISVFILEEVPFGSAGVSGGSPEVVQGRLRDATVTFAVRYYIQNPETDERIRDAYYYARATERVIRRFNQNLTQRTRNNIQIRLITDMRFVPFFQDEQFGGLTWYYLITYVVRDERP